MFGDAGGEVSVGFTRTVGAIANARKFTNNLSLQGKDPWLFLTAQTSTESNECLCH